MAFFPSVTSLLRGNKRGHSEDDSDNDSDATEKTPSDDMIAPASPKKFKPILEIHSLQKREYCFAWRIGSFAAVRNQKVPLEFSVSVADLCGISSDWTFQFLQEANGLGHIQRKLEGVDGFTVLKNGMFTSVFRDDSPTNQKIGTEDLPKVNNSLDMEIVDKDGNLVFSNTGKISCLRMLESVDESRWFPLDELPVLEDGSLVIRMTFGLYTDKQQAPNWWSLF